MSAPISSRAHDAVAPLLGFQALLRRCHTAADRKHLVLTAWETGALNRHEASLLVTAGLLETA